MGTRRAHRDAPAESIWVVIDFGYASATPLDQALDAAARALLEWEPHGELDVVCHGDATRLYFSIAIRIRRAAYTMSEAETIHEAVRTALGARGLSLTRILIGKAGLFSLPGQAPTWGR